MTNDNPLSDTYTQEIFDWDGFDKTVSGMRNREWIFRGQSDAVWGLESSLYRTFKYTEELTKLSRGRPKKIARNRHEELAIERFINTAHLYLDYRPPKKQVLEWLAIMQHYGAPTRLIDFTFSPYVAAYFALETGVGNAAIYCIARKKNSKLLVNHRNFKLSDDKPLMYIFEPNFPSERLLAQQGVFLVAGTLNKSHDEIIKSREGEDNDFLIKLISHLTQQREKPG